VFSPCFILIRLRLNAFVVQPHCQATMPPLLSETAHSPERSVRAHLVMLLLAAALPLITFAAIVTATFWHLQRATFEQQYLERTRAMALALDREQDGHVRVLLALSRSRPLAQGDLGGFYEQAKEVMADQPGWATVILADLDATQLLTLRLPFGSALPKAAFGSAAIAQIAATGRPQITPLFKENVTGTYVTQIGVPVWRDGAVTHVLIAAIDPPSWLAFLRRYPVAEDATLTLLDQNGIVIARTLNNERWVGRPAPPAFSERLHATPEAAFQVTGLEGQPFYAAFSRSPISGWTIATGVPSQTVEAALWRSTLAMAGGGLLCLGLAAGFAYLFGRRIAASIAALASAATQLGSARQLPFSELAKPSGTVKEINTLRRVLHESASRLHAEHLERERVQLALQESEKRFRALTAASSDALYRMSPDWQEMRQIHSRNFVEAMSAPNREWVQKYIPADDQPDLLEVINDAIQSKGTFELEHRVLRTDGSAGWTLSRAVPILDENGDIIEWFGTASNVTARKQAEQALRDARVSAERAKADAETANAAKDQFLAVLSHELRTPLAPVLAAVELLQRRHALGSDASKLLQIIYRNAQLQGRLIDDLLDITRIAQGKLELKRKPVNIHTVIEGAVEVAKADIDAKKINFSLILNNVPDHVDADALRLQQVIWNLLSNAVKFTPSGGSVELRCDRVDGQVVIEVADSGIGIEAEATERIFRAFEQAERTITRRFGGLGLGLAIAKQLIELHDGCISARSDGSNQGSTFRIQLPAITASLESAPSRLAQAPEGIAQRILLVEDNTDAASTMKLLLESFGHDVLLAGSVRQALQATETTSFDLLISDLGLPDESGIALMQELRRRGHTFTGIALSGYGLDEDVRRSKEAGFAAHLVKPVEVDVLVQTIARVGIAHRR
jgi:signal transduction histidine kinase